MIAHAFGKWYTFKNVLKKLTRQPFLAGILAFAILQLRDKGGLTGWQWLFLIEGIPTVLVAAVAS